MPVPLHFITAVWGEAYTRLFLDVVLPNNLSAGNLGSCRGRAGTRYRVFTTAADARQIAASPAWQRAGELAQTEICEIAESPQLAHHTRMTMCHRHAVADAAREDAALVFLAPDAIWSDGTFAHVARQVDQGWRGVLVAGLRVKRDVFTPVLKERFSTTDGTIAIPSRELVALAMKHLHPLTRDQIITSARFMRGTPTIHWPVGQDGLLLRGFHLHPLMLRPTRRDARIDTTVDGEFIGRAVPNPASLTIETDSDTVCCCDLTDSASMLNYLVMTTGDRVKEVALWAFSNADAHHWRFVRQKIRFHAGELGPEWTAAEAESDRFINEVLATAKSPHFYLQQRLLLLRKRWWVAHMLAHPRHFARSVLSRWTKDKGAKPDPQHHDSCPICHCMVCGHRG